MGDLENAELIILPFLFWTQPVFQNLLLPAFLPIWWQVHPMSFSSMITLFQVHLILACFSFQKLFPSSTLSYVFLFTHYFDSFKQPTNIHILKGLFFSFFYFTNLYWFCYTSTCIRHGFTRVPHPEPPSHFPPHTIPLGHPTAPAPSFLYPASNLDWWFVSYMILYMF